MPSKSTILELLTATTIGRFRSRVDSSGPDCWPWTGSINEHGYGTLQIGGRAGRRERAHRIAFSLANGDIPPGMAVCHSCDNPACCRPDHLWLGTQADNLRDMFRKGRARRGYIDNRGERHGMAKLSPEQVEHIRVLASRGVPQRRIAMDFGITQGAVSMIHRRATWSSL